MNILVLQHEKVEHPGIFREFLAEDGHSWTAIELDEGEPLPSSLDGYDALWVLGGPMDVWQEKEHPWLVAEKAFIKEAVEQRGLPYLGLCLGHQLLAEALGGSCGPSEQPEIGVLDVQLTEEGASGIFLDDVPTTLKALQWHSAEIKTMPPGASCLATSDACAVQAMCWGPRAYSLQFHVEIEADTVDTWSAIPEYRDALKAALGENGVGIMREAASAEMANFNKYAERIYINWLQTAARPASGTART